MSKQSINTRMSSEHKANSKANYAKTTVAQFPKEIKGITAYRCTYYRQLVGHTPFYMV